MGVCVWGGGGGGEMITGSQTIARGGGGKIALVVHGSDEAPLVGGGGVSLGGVLAHVAIKAAHGIDKVLVHSHTHVTPTHNVSIAHSQPHSHNAYTQCIHCTFTATLT
jgi:hypothetical protein